MGAFINRFWLQICLAWSLLKKARMFNTLAFSRFPRRHALLPKSVSTSAQLLEESWKTPTVFLRSLAFNVYIRLTSFPLFVIFLPYALLGKRHSCVACRVWGKNVLYSAKYIAGIDYALKGGLPKTPVIIASKHQSAWETALFHVIGIDAAYILKKELLYVPGFNVHAVLSGQIAVDRNGGASSIKNLIRKARERIAEGRQVVIFPEGTRMKYGAAPDYKPGVAALYSSVEADIIPVALDSGKFWPKNSFWKRPGMVTVSILPAITKGLPKREFMQVLETQIESECAKIAQKA